MLSVALYLAVLPPILLFMIWHLTSTISPPPSPTALTNKRIILLIAHPDDESMFFSPSVQALTKPDLGNHVKILCMSTGDSEGLGETRKAELEKAAVTLGLRRKEDVFVMNDRRFRDGMKEEWDEKEIARVLAQAFAPQLIPNSNTTHHARTASGIDLDVKHKRTSSDVPSKSDAYLKPPSKATTKTSAKAASTTSALHMAREGISAQTEGPQASIDILLTFDAFGISGHPNHKSLYHGSKLFVQHLMRGQAGYACPIVLYTLTTTNILRKYSFIMDILTTYAVNVFTAIFNNIKNFRKAAAAPSRSNRGDNHIVFVSNISRYLVAREAMVRGHKSQMVWFRWGWISLGRYMVINDLRREPINSG